MQGKHHLTLIAALTAADSVDVVVDATGSVEFGAHLALSVKSL
jgi:predicted homoserine dehydrogenase-like protein